MSPRPGRPAGEGAVERPIVVLLGGVPGSGKTALGARLTDRFQLPILGNDLLKAGLVITRAARDRSQLRPRAAGGDAAVDAELYEAGFAALREVTDVLVDRGVSFGLEQMWSRRHGRSQLAPLLDRCRAVLLHCSVARETAISRVRTRAAASGRLCYADENLLRWITGPDFPWEDHEQPLDAAVPTLVVDTSDGYDPGIEEIERFVWEETLGSGE